MSFNQDGTRTRQKASIFTGAASGVLAGVFSVEFDVSENETHRSSATITKHPVEAGAKITDHIIPESDSLDLVARVSNTPIVSEADAFVLTPNRAEDAYNTLIRMKNAGTIVSVLTTLREYSNMGIAEVSCTRNAATGDVVALTLKLEEIRTATSETIEVPLPATPRGNVSKDVGKVTTTDATASVDERAQTLLLRFGRAVGAPVD